MYKCSRTPREHPRWLFAWAGVAPRRNLQYKTEIHSLPRLPAPCFWKTFLSTLYTFLLCALFLGCSSSDETLCQHMVMRYFVLPYGEKCYFQLEIENTRYLGLYYGKHRLQYIVDGCARPFPTDISNYWIHHPSPPRSEKSILWKTLSMDEFVSLGDGEHHISWRFGPVSSNEVVVIVENGQAKIISDRCSSRLMEYATAWGYQRPHPK